MRAKPIVNLALVLFVAVALILVVRQSKLPSPQAPVRTAVAQGASLPAVQAAEKSVEPAAAVPATRAADDPAAVAKPAAAAPIPSPGKARASVKTEAATPAAGEPRHKVVAMYFHGDVRCTTCRKVEAYAREAVEEGFRPQVAAGAVEFRAVNVDRPENGHFVEDYQLTNKSVVVVDEVGGKVERWVKLDNVWGLVGDRAAYLDYVQDAVRAYVEN